MIHQLLVQAGDGDPLTYGALRLRGHLSAFTDAQVYAIHLLDRVDGVRDLSELPFADASADDVLVVHAEPALSEIDVHLERWPGKVVVVRRPVSSAESVAPYAPALASLLARFAEDVERLSDRAVLVWDQPIDITTNPLDVEPSESTLSHVESFGDDMIVLADMAFMPESHVEQLLAAYSVLVTNTRPSLRLIVAGAAPLPRYHEVLQHYAREMNLSGVWLAAHVSRGDLSAFYRKATAVLYIGENTRGERLAAQVGAPRLDIRDLAESPLALADAIDELLSQNERIDVDLTASASAFEEANLQRFADRLRVLVQ